MAPRPSRRPPAPPHPLRVQAQSPAKRTALARNNRPTNKKNQQEENDKESVSEQKEETQVQEDQVEEETSFDPSMKDDYCALCGMGGELLMCFQCVNSYHPFCIRKLRTERMALEQQMGIGQREKEEEAKEKKPGRRGSKRSLAAAKAADEELYDRLEDYPDDWVCGRASGLQCSSRLKPRREDDQLTQEEAAHFKWLGLSEKIGSRRYYKRFERADETFQTGDFVSLANEEDLDCSLAAQLLSCFQEKDTSHRKIEVRWFWTSQEIERKERAEGRRKGRAQEESNPQELFFSPYSAIYPVESIQCRMLVVGREEYEKREEEGALDEFVFFCSKKYNEENGELRPLIGDTEKLQLKRPLLAKAIGARRGRKRKSAAPPEHTIKLLDEKEGLEDEEEDEDEDEDDEEEDIDEDGSNEGRKGNEEGQEGLEHASEKEHLSFNLYKEACASLQLSNVPASLPCRESERDQILSFLRTSLQKGSSVGGALYMAGVPGTGKTASVRQVVRALYKERRQQQKEQEDDLKRPKHGKIGKQESLVPVFDYVEINGMKLPDPYHFYSFLCFSLSGKRLSNTKALEWLDNYFASPSSSRHLLVLLIDELDFFLTKKQDVLYHLFSWPTKENSRLLLIGISNTIDFPDRLFPRVSSRIGMNKIHFKPYNQEEIQFILKQRLKRSKKLERIIKKDSFSLLAMKIASVSGDIRRALQICRRAVEIAEDETKKKWKKKKRQEEEEEEEDEAEDDNENNDSLLSADKNILTEEEADIALEQQLIEECREEDLVLVDLRHIEKACQDLVNNNVVEVISRCTLYEKLTLFSLQAELKLGGGSYIPFLAVYQRAERVALSKSIAPFFSQEGMLLILSNLASLSLLALDYSQRKRFPLISLGGLLPEDISEAFSADDVFYSS